jgi:hypothetical protein
MCEKQTILVRKFVETDVRARAGGPPTATTAKATMREA